MGVIVAVLAWTCREEPVPGVTPEVARLVRQLQAKPGIPARLATRAARALSGRTPRWLPGFLDVDRAGQRNIEAAHRLLRMGPELAPALPALVEVFGDTDPSVAFYAFLVASYSGVAPADFVKEVRARVPAVADAGSRFYAGLLATEDEHLRDFAWGCLEAAGPPGDGVRGRLEELAREGDPGLRERARRLLAGPGPGTTPGL